MGYATINGDMSGGFAPIADVTKTKLFALAKWLNKNREIKNAIPQSIIEKRPGAELAINPKTGKPLLAEEALMPYEFLDEVIWRVENLHQTINDMLDVEFVYERENSLSKEQKTDWLEKFFRRMSYSQYKWTIMAPAPIVDAHSINKAEYSQPIIASGIDYKKTSIEYKKQILNN
jgi:NH3-dependent NAD+ synthetase